jgi:hypothetical protein
MEPVKDVAALEEDQHQEDVNPDQIHEDQKRSNFGVQSEYEYDNEQHGKRSDCGSAARDAP